MDITNAQRARVLVHALPYIQDYSGKIVVPRTEVAAIADKAGLAAAGLTTTGYAEGESLKVRGGKLYLGVACRDGSSGNRRANILVYDCVQGE